MFKSHKFLFLAGIIYVTLIILFGVTFIWTGIGSNPTQAISLASAKTCSDIPVGTTQETPKGSTVRFIGNTIDTSGLEITLNSINTSNIGLVSAKFKVTNLTNNVISSGLYANTGVIGSNGSYYSACLGGSSKCPFNINSQAIEPNKSQGLCVSYLLPKSITITEVEYVPQPNNNNDYKVNPILWLIK